MLKQRRRIDKGLHSLLSVAHQSMLKTAYEADSLNVLDATIKQVMEEAPNKFHTSSSLKERVFYDEPMDNRNPVPRAGCINPRPKTIYSPPLEIK